MTFFLLFLYLALLSSQLDRAGSFRFLRSTVKRQLSDIPRLQLRLDANKPSTAAVIVASSFIFLTGSSISIAAGLEDFDSTPVKATNQYDYAQEMNDAAQVKKPKVIGSTSVAVTPSAKLNDGDRYKANLAKEKKKLKEIKNKSKKERNQDMCEVLGRGC